MNEVSISQKDHEAESRASTPSHDPVLTSFASLRGKRVGIFGGSFDPPHRGHLEAALDAFSALELDALVFVPNAQNPLKHNPAVSSSDRFEMVKRMIARIPGFYVSYIECEREGPSYTVDTLEEIVDAIGESPKPYLIIGSDCITNLPRWHEIERIAELANIACTTRAGFETELYSPYVKVKVEGVYVPLSSTEIKEMLSKNQDVSAVVPGPVLEYIAERHLW